MKSRNLIFEALAFIENYESNPNMTKAVNLKKGFDIYIKNAVVSLLTVKKHNPDTDLALVTNIELEKKWKEIFLSNNIKVLKCDYTEYRMPADTVYSLSYYKLCAFDFILSHTEYERYCFLDCDTYGVGSFKKLWIEADSAFLMIPNDSGIDAKIRKELIDIYELINDGTSKKIPHISSGFIVGTRYDLLSVMMGCKKIYNTLISLEHISPQGGDEVIWSLALADYSGKMYSPKAYVLLSNIGAKEYWVDKPDFQDENIVMWHLPAEKRYALIWAFNKFQKTGKFPEIREMARACRIRHIRNHFTILSVRAILLDHTSIKRNVLKLRRKLSGKS